MCLDRSILQGRVYATVVRRQDSVASQVSHVSWLGPQERCLADGARSITPPGDADLDVCGPWGGFCPDEPLIGLGARDDQLPGQRQQRVMVIEPPK